MRRLREELRARSLLDDPARVHDERPLADVRQRREVPALVGDRRSRMEGVEDGIDVGAIGHVAAER